MLEVLPKFSAELGRLSERQHAMEQKLPVGGKPPPLPLSRSFEGHSSSHPTVQHLAKAIQPPPRTATRSNLGLLTSPGEDQPLDLAALEDEKLAADPISSQTSGDALARAVLVQSQVLTTLVQQIASAHSDPMADLTGVAGAGWTRGASARV